MATVVNARDVRLQAAPTRVANVSMAPNLIVDQSQVTGLGLVVAGTKMVSLAATTQVFQIAKSGAVSPASSVLTATLRNITGTPSLTVVSGTISPTPVLSGGAVTIANGSMTTDSATIRLSVTEGGTTYTDEVTLVKVREGIDSLTAFLTNESHAITADSLGNPIGYAGASGNFKVFQGTNDVTSVCTYSLVAGGNPSGLTYTLNAATGAYSVTGGYPIGTDLTTLTFRATFGTATMDKVFTLSKSKAGSSNISGYLTNESQTIATATDGSGGVYTNAGGTFKVFDGITPKTTGVTFSISTAASSGLTTSINATTGVYTASLNTASDNGTVTFRAAFNGVNIDKTYTISKSKGGVDAQLLSLTSNTQTVTFDGAGALSPASQTITFTANLQNLTGIATFTAVPYDVNNVAGSGLTLGGSGTNVRTLSGATFGANQYVVVTATLAGQSDKVTVVRLKDGTNAVNPISGYLTNESHTVATSSTGSGGSYTNAGGSFKVFDGTADVSASALSVFSISQAASTGMTASINSTTGVYTASLDTATDLGTVTFRVTYKGVTIDKRYTLSKSKGGANGADAPLITLSADRQTVAYNNAGVATPSVQTTLFTLTRQNITTNDSWAMEDMAGNLLEPVSSYTGSASALGVEGLTMSVSEFNSGRGATNGIKLTNRVPYGSIISYQSLLEDGWVATRGTLSPVSGEVATWTPTSANAYFSKTITSLGLTGSQIKCIRVQARRIAGTGDLEANLYYSNVNHGGTASFYKHAHRQGSLESWAYYDFDMRSLTVGDVADWDDNIVDIIRIDLTSADGTTGDVWEIDYIAMYTNILTDTVSVVKVQDGATGAKGDKGDEGTAGVRGSRTFYVALSGSTATYSTSLATTTASVDGGPVKNDVVVQYNDGISPGFSETRFWSGSAWLVVNAIVDGNLLVTGTVGTDALSANSVSATKIASNAVTAAKIAAGAITADKIAANSVTADKLLVAGGNLIANGDFRTGNKTGWLDWTAAENFEVFDFSASATPPPSHYAGRFFGSGTLVPQCSMFAHVDAYDSTVSARMAGFEVQVGEEYYLSCYAYRNSSFNGDGLEMRIYYQLADGTFAGTSSGTTINAALTTSWAKYEGTFTPPATAVSGWLIVTARNFSAGAMYFTKCFVARKASSVLIENGAVTADKVAANAITATKIAADAVTASKINVTSLSSVSATIGTLRTASTGSRMELMDNVIKIYDGSTLRVQLGNLSL